MKQLLMLMRLLCSVDTPSQDVIVKKVFEWCRVSTVYVFMICTCLSVACCSDDEEEDSSGFNVSPIVGNWTRTYQDHGSVTVNLSLKADKTYTEEAWVDGEKTMDDYGVYSYNATTTVLSTVSKAGYQPYTYTYFVTNVSDQVLVLMFSDYSGSLTYTKK